jgi:SAM-dependent methyltransferase
MKNFFRRMKEGTESLNYGREIITRWACELFPPAAASGEPVTVLDLGCGLGDDLVNVRTAISPRTIRLLGIENYPPNQDTARRHGIEVASADLERAAFPWHDGSVDLIIANQIIEHTKEIFWIFSECSRVLKPGGAVIVGVPNLASFHNRLLLLFGDQPSSIELLGPHVRGITIPAFRRFIEADGFFRVEKIRGSNMYPLPASVSLILSRLFPRLSVSIFFLVRKTGRPGLFRDILATRFYETNFYTGPSNL